MFSEGVEPESILKRGAKPDKPVLRLLRGPLCPNCQNPEGGEGIVHQVGLQQWPIVQCFYCAARLFVGENDFRHVVPEDKAPAIRADFLTPRPFNDGLDGFNRQVADITGIVQEHERKFLYWKGRLEQVKRRRAEFMGVVSAEITTKCLFCKRDYPTSPDVKGCSDCRNKQPLFRSEIAGDSRTAQKPLSDAPARKQVESEQSGAT